MRCDLHHAHLFATDLDASISFYRDMLGAEVQLDQELAGSRNVLLRLGTGHLNFYDQPPKLKGRAVHHLGIRTDDLDALVEHMQSREFAFRKAVTDLGVLRYVMAEAPDGLLLELFETSLDSGR